MHRDAPARSVGIAVSLGRRGGQIKETIHTGGVVSRSHDSCLVREPVAITVAGSTTELSLSDAKALLAGLAQAVARVETHEAVLRGKGDTFHLLVLGAARSGMSMLCSKLPTTGRVSPTRLGMSASSAEILRLAVLQGGQVVILDKGQSVDGIRAAGDGCGNEAYQQLMRLGRKRNSRAIPRQTQPFYRQFEKNGFRGSKR